MARALITHDFPTGHRLLVEVETDEFGAEATAAVDANAAVLFHLACKDVANYFALPNPETCSA